MAAMPTMARFRAGYFDQVSPMPALRPCPSTAPGTLRVCGNGLESTATSGPPFFSKGKGEWGCFFFFFFLGFFFGLMFFFFFFFFFKPYRMSRT